MKSFRSPDGMQWSVTVKVPSHSSAMVVFAPVGEATSRHDRYAWLNSHTPDANDPCARLKPADVLASLDDANLARLFRRAMPVHTERAVYVGA
ncbi:MAG: hypothetical protein U0163_08405 [Gemmatimonadaceae bacterium]